MERTIADLTLPKAENNFDVNLCDVEESKLFELFAESKRLFCPQVWTDKHGHSLRWKFIFALFQGSSLEQGIKKVLDYEMDVEVVKSVFNRHYSAWSQGISEWGRYNGQGLRLWYIDERAWKLPIVSITVRISWYRQNYRLCLICSQLLPRDST